VTDQQRGFGAAFVDQAANVGGQLLGIIRRDAVNIQARV
jgi:hypothetical protein